MSIDHIIITYIVIAVLLFFRNYDFKIIYYVKIGVVQRIEINYMPFISGALREATVSVDHENGSSCVMGTIELLAIKVLTAAPSGV